MGEVRKVGVIGLGAMGAGIAQLCVEAGVDTVGREVSAELGEKARDRIGALPHPQGREGPARAGGARRGRRPALADDASSTSLADCDLVIEAIVEELEPKRELFAELDRICRPDAVLATNTSALSVTEIARGDDPARARRRHALLQPGAADAARRDRPRRADRGRAVRDRATRSASGSGRRRSAATTRRASSSTAS